MEFAQEAQGRRIPVPEDRVGLHEVLGIANLGAVVRVPDVCGGRGEIEQHRGDVEILEHGGAIGRPGRELVPRAPESETLPEQQCRLAVILGIVPVVFLKGLQRLGILLSQKMNQGDKKAHPLIIARVQAEDLLEVAGCLRESPLMPFGHRAAIESAEVGACLDILPPLG